MFSPIDLTLLLLYWPPRNVLLGISNGSSAFLERLSKQNATLKSVLPVQLKGCLVHLLPYVYAHSHLQRKIPLFGCNTASLLREMHLRRSFVSSDFWRSCFGRCASGSTPVPQAIASYRKRLVPIARMSMSLRPFPQPFPCLWH